MSSVQVRPFRRSDRDQLTQLVNAHAQPVVPGMSVSVNTVLGSLERQPGEFIEDPWVAERVTLAAGFTHTGHTEIVYLARVEDLPHPDGVPLAGLSVARSVGINGVRLSAVLGPDVIGYIEVETFDEGERLARTGGWADVGNLRVSEPYRRRGVGSWLLGQAADWLRLARVDRLLDYAWLEGTDRREWHVRHTPAACPALA